MNENFKFNLLIKLYFLFNDNQKMSPLKWYYNKFGVFKLCEVKFKEEKIKSKDIKKVYRFSLKISSLYDLIIALIEDAILIFEKKDAISDLKVNKKIINNETVMKGIICNDLLKVILNVQKTPLMNCYDKLSPLLYNICKNKNIIITELYLFFSFIVVNIKKKSLEENIKFDIFN